MLIASGLASACLVSFEGYEPLGTGRGGDAAGTSGKSSGGSKPSGGRGGTTSNGGDDSLGGAGEAGRDVGGSSSGSGGSNGGAATAGDGPMGGDSPMGGSAGAAMGGTAGSSGSSGNGGNGGSGGSEPKNCPVNLEGPPLIEIAKPGGGFYCMDRTEITNEQYAAFLAANPATAGQDAACSWNSTYAPDVSATCATTAQRKYDPVTRPKAPVGCIDWCDAKRYCAWAGKRLCGAIGGGSNPPASFADASASQWYRACSKAGTQKFPYGNQYHADYCNGADVGTHPDDVATYANCVGGYSGLFDMSGNVAEWEDSCSASAGANDNCLYRGGSVENVDVLTPSLLCNSSAPDDDTPSPVTAKRSTKDELIGLRCCLDP